MKAIRGFWSCLLVVAISLLGCAKSDKPAAGASVQVIDATHLRPAFASASPEARATVDNVMMSIQGSDYANALRQLDQLANTPNLTDAQKKVVSDVTDQIRKRMAATTAAPSQ